MMNEKEGFNRKLDNFPKEWFKPLKFGNDQLELKDFFGGININQDLANQLLDNYYDERGGHKNNGNPTEAKIKELSLDRFK